MATELLKAAQLLATTDLLAPEAELVEEAQPVVRREQLRTYAQRSIRVVLGGGGQSGKQNAAVLLRGVSGDAVYRTTQFFRRFGDVESAQQRPRSPSSRDCDVVIMFATGAPAERFIQYAAKEGMPLEIQRNGAVPGARGHGLSKRTRDQDTPSDPECAHWMQDIANNVGRPSKRSAYHTNATAVRSSTSPSSSTSGEEDASESDVLHDEMSEAVLKELEAIRSGQREQRTKDALDKKGVEMRDYVDQIKNCDTIKRKHIHLEQPSHPPQHEKAQFMCAVAAEAKAEFMSAVQEEHARSIVQPSNWGLDADAARIAAAAAEAAVAKMRAGSGFDISFDDLTLDSSSEGDGDGDGPGNEMELLLAQSCEPFVVAMLNVDAALPEARFQAGGEGAPTPRNVPAPAPAQAHVSGGSPVRQPELSEETIFVDRLLDGVRQL